MIDHRHTDMQIPNMAVCLCDTTMTLKAMLKQSGTAYVLVHVIIVILYLLACLVPVHREVRL